MAFRRLEESPKEAIPGQILLVVHDFEARSPDELSLAKGDKIELIERDDDFGDGWYLGKHLENGRTGLFPEVYTMTAPRQANLLSTKSGSGVGSVTLKSADIPTDTSVISSDSDKHSTSSAVSHDTATRSTAYYDSPDDRITPARAAPSPLNTSSPNPRTSSAPAATYQAQTTTAAIAAQRSIGMMMGNSRNHGEDSPVMNETLSVIDEHITDLNTPRSSLLAVDHRANNDSGSEYSSHIDHRLSYINGNETDEEERIAHSEAEVLTWTPTQVAQYLKEIGVEKRHCEIFKEQEISGEVLIGMDQASVFMKEFDLGLVGRRLRTWHKIKAFQEEIKAHPRSTSGFGGGDGSSDDLGRSRSQSSVNGSMLPRIPSLIDHSGSRVNTRHTRQGSPRTLSQPQPPSSTQAQPKSTRSDTSSMPINSTYNHAESPRRPSAASVREFNHSRRHSSADFTPKSPSSNLLSADRTDSPSQSPSSPHKKQPSFDRNWTMSGAISNASGRATTALGITALGMGGHALSLSTDRNTFNPSLQDLGLAPPPSRESDRGYTSGGEMESKKLRNVLRKRDAVSASHSRQSSYKDDSGTNLSIPRRHSRFGSADSIRDTLAAVTSPASKIYHGNGFKGRFRSVSGRESSSNTGSPISSPQDPTSPTVTKLEYPDSPATSVTSPSPKPDNGSPSTVHRPFSQSNQSNQASPKPRMGVRTTSDAVTGSEKALLMSSTSGPSPIKESPVQSPTRTGSTTTSGASVELESTDASSKSTNNALTMTSTASTKRGKDKKKTSAYTRGLEKKTPQEQMVGCDYSGWMKKKSPSLMTTWKPRLFVLRGRRLSYYYTENDTEEKGLIDISSHRVLPADNDRITGLHATVTGAKSTPTSPANAQTPTLNATEAAAQTESSLQKPVGEGIFIFKLVPPRAGLSRAVNFTKPTVHYFAVDNIQQGRLWMAALMKATIDRDETSPLKTTYTQKTISLAKAKAMRQRPPALMGLDEELARNAEEKNTESKPDKSGLNIQGLNLSYEYIASDADKATAENGTPPPYQPRSAPLASEKSAEGIATTNGTIIEANSEAGPSGTLGTEKGSKNEGSYETLPTETTGHPLGAEQRSRASSAVRLGDTPSSTSRERAFSGPS
ncbi:polar growth protein [Trapelia coarctata]|nr:polar growth protein [Trapelia coarctata]